jgi:hypothetical protein
MVLALPAGFFLGVYHLSCLSYSKLSVPLSVPIAPNPFA